jgi:hypothetical protein
LSTLISNFFDSRTSKAIVKKSGEDVITAAAAASIRFVVLQRLDKARPLV